MVSKSCFAHLEIILKGLAGGIVVLEKTMLAGSMIHNLVRADWM
jgi:hypothetical protein